MSEKLASFSLDDAKQSGIPTDRLVNLYEKFGHGGFGMVITGNVMVGSVSIAYFAVWLYLIRPHKHPARAGVRIVKNEWEYLPCLVPVSA